MGAGKVSERRFLGLPVAGKWLLLKAWEHLESNYYDYFLMPPVKVDVALKFLLGLLASIVLVTLALWCVYHLLSRLRFPQRTRLMALAFFGALALSLT